MLILLAAQCDATGCTVPPRPAAMTSLPTHVAHVEVVSEVTGRVVHRAAGPLRWKKKTHLGGIDLRDLGFDVPDYEVNAHPIAPREVWVST